MKLTAEQVEILLRDLNQTRVATRQQAGRSLSYMEAYDVRAHLIRVFGFANWDGEVVASDVAFEHETTVGKGDYAKPGWQVGYRVLYRLTVRNPDGSQAASYSEAAVGFATIPDRGEAHDMACKAAASDALKRCAMNLGTQFGLSLYRDGTTKDVVRTTLVRPEGMPARPTVTTESGTVIHTDTGEIATQAPQRRQETPARQEEPRRFRTRLPETQVPDVPGLPPEADVDEDTEAEIRAEADEMLAAARATKALRP